MKTLLLILALSIGAYAQSLDETILYINEKLPEAGSLRVAPEMSFRIESAVSGCNAVWFESYTLTRESRPFSIFKVSAPLKSLTATVAESTKWKPFWQITFSGDITLDQRGIIIPQTTEPLTIKDRETAERLAKAFTHAADLCRQKKDLF